MSILIESPTAESIWQVVQQLPAAEIERLKELMGTPRVETIEEEENEWREISQHVAARFFDDEGESS